MKRITFLILITSAFLVACGKKEKQGIIVYSVSYQLPDSLTRFATFLPKEAKIYFKGDSAVAIQGTGNESTTVITDKATGSMRVLLKSSSKEYVVDYNKTDQAQEESLLPKYSYTKTASSKTIAGYKAIKYMLTDKTTGDSTEAWFTKDIKVTSNSITSVFDQSLGVPLVFTTNQNGIISRTTVKEIKFDDIPAGVFSTPAGYAPLTPQQLKELPVEN